MHEFGMVDEFIHLLIKQWKDPAQTPPRVFQILYGPGLAEESLRQAFEVHTLGTALEGAHFEFRKKSIPMPCACGALVRDGTEAVDFPYAICPDCQHVLPIPGYNVLELHDAE